MNTKNTKTTKTTKPADNKALSVSALGATPEEVKASLDAINNSRFSVLMNKELAANCVKLDALAKNNALLIVDKCRIYGDILTRELWKDEFESFKDFAETVFGDKKSVAYMQAKAGASFYSKDANTVEGKLGACNGYSVLDKLSGLTHDELLQLEADVFSKEGYNLTQDRAAELAKAAIEARPKDGKAAKEKVVKTFDFTGMVYRMPYEKTDAEGKTTYVPASAEPCKTENVPEVADAIELTDFVMKTFKFESVSFIVVVDSVGNVQIMTQSLHKPKENKIDAGSYNRIRKGYEKGWDAEDVSDMTGIAIQKVRDIYAELDKLKGNKGE